MMHHDARFRLLMDTAPVLIWCADPDRRCVYFNKAWLDFTGRTLQQEVDFGWANSVHPEDDVQRAEIYAQHFATRAPFRVEYRLRRFDGAWRWMLGTGAPRTDLAGVYAGFIGSCIDVTDLKEAEAQRQRDLDEKAALLQELHHRVKNNAQVFASLLGVQASRAGDPAVQTALRVAAARASTMAIAQQQIWNAGSSARFDLTELARKVLHSARSGPLELVLEAPEPVLVPLATAVPLGLILHELIANAVRHAFPESGSGHVAVRLQRESVGRLRITVADDGIGMEQGLDNPGVRSAGLTIVRSLARQIGAVLSLGPGPGTEINLSLPNPAAVAATSA